jgi:integrase
VESTPKTEDSAATIALDSINVTALREHRDRQLAERAELVERDLPWTDTGKVFTTETGEWLHTEKVSDVFRRLCREADLPPINLRDLRHVAATLIHAGGGDIHAVKETLRHSTSSCRRTPMRACSPTSTARSRRRRRRWYPGHGERRSSGPPLTHRSRRTPQTNERPTPV